MDPVFTLPYSELAVAELLSKHFKTRHGYSIFVPVSRTEKGIDLLLSRRSESRLSSVTFQVKASRTYLGDAVVTKSGKRKFRYSTWFKRFDVPQQADFVVLFGTYAPEPSRRKHVSPGWWRSLVLVFSQIEMHNFMAGVMTKSGKPDKMFGFGFDHEGEAFLTRGEQAREPRDLSAHLFSRKVDEIKTAL